MSSIRRIYIVLFLSILSSMQSTDLWAAPQPNSAEALFLEAVVLLGEKRFDEACSKLEQSLELQQNPSTLFALGECNELRGHFVAGIKAYTAYIASYSELPDEKKPQHETRMTRAQERLEALRPQVSALRVIVISTSASKFEVSLDGQETKTTDSEITFYPLEPVEHRVVVKAPETEPQEARVTLEKGEHRRLEIRMPSPRKPAQVAPVNVETPFAPPGAPQRLTPMKIGGFVSLGIGAVGLVVGAVGAGSAISKMDEIEQNCVLNTAGNIAPCQTQAGFDTAKSAQMNANLATAGFSVALAGAVAGTVLLALDKKSEKTSTKASRPAVMPRFGVSTSGAGVFLEGVW